MRNQFISRKAAKITEIGHSHHRVLCLLLMSTKVVPKQYYEKLSHFPPLMSPCNPAAPVACRDCLHCRATFPIVAGL